MSKEAMASMELAVAIKDSQLARSPMADADRIAI